MLISTLLSYMNDCGKPLKRLKCSPCQRQRDRSGTTVKKLRLFHWSQVTWSWLKLMPTGGGGKWRTSGRMNCTKWNARLQKASLTTSWKTSGQDAHKFSTETDFSSLLLQRGLPLCMIVHTKQARCTTTTLEEQTQKSETEKVPQSANCPLLAQHETGETPLGCRWMGNSVHSCRYFPELPG